MDAEQRLIMMLTLIGLILLSIVALVLFFALWPYRVIIGFTLIGLVALVLLLAIGIAVNEQILRHKRVKFHTELPLDRHGHPLYLPKLMQPYPEGGRSDD